MKKKRNYSEGNKKKFLKAFTVIELLVVISLIGFIVSIILVSVKTGIERAKINHLLQFSATFKHALGAYIVGEWNFEDNLSDLSGSNNNCNWVGTGPSYIDNEASPHLGKTVQFDGSNYADCGNKDSLNVGTGDFTIELWAECTTYIDNAGLVLKKGPHYWSGIGYGITQIYNPNYLCFVINDGSGPKFLQTSLGAPSEADATFDWSHIVGVKRGNKIEVWVNGKKEGETDGLSGSLDNAYDLTIGRSSDGYFRGSIDEVRIYKDALSSAQIKNHYVRGIIKRKLAIFK